MAHTKSGGSTSLGRDSQSKRLGVKIPSGKAVKPGQIIVRQRGSKFRAGKNVRRGNDDTLYAASKGTVSFGQRKTTNFNGKLNKIKIVSVFNS
ncbi:50S ribosomal protein L27 [Patescibacteria group bacterium]